MEEDSHYNQNSVDFDPFAYFLNHLNNNTLKELVSKNMDIQQEITFFDQDIDSLVFDNYSKFMSSIDKIKQMKESTEGVSKKMSKLRSSIKKVNDLSLKIDKTLLTKRLEMQKYHIIQKDLANLNKISELPIILKQELFAYKNTIKELLGNSDNSKEKKVSSINFPKELLQRLNQEVQFQKPAEYYYECSKNLEIFKGEPLIKPLYTESMLYIDELKQILNDLVLNKNLNGLKLRSILYNYLCFVENKEPILINYQKNQTDYYTNRLRGFFIVAEKEILNQFKDYSIKSEDIGEIELSSMYDRFADYFVKKISNEGFCVAYEYSRLNSQVYNEVISHFQESVIHSEFQKLFEDLKLEIKFLLDRVSNICQKNEDIIQVQTILLQLLQTIVEQMTKRIGEVSIPFTIIQFFMSTTIKECLEIKKIFKDQLVIKKFDQLILNFQVSVTWISQQIILDRFVEFTKNLKSNCLIMEREVAKKQTQGKGSSTWNACTQKYEKYTQLKLNILGINFVILSLQFLDIVKSLTVNINANIISNTKKIGITDPIIGSSSKKKKTIVKKMKVKEVLKMSEQKRNSLGISSKDNEKIFGNNYNYLDKAYENDYIEYLWDNFLGGLEQILVGQDENFDECEQVRFYNKIIKETQTEEYKSDKFNHIVNNPLKSKIYQSLKTKVKNLAKEKYSQTYSFVLEKLLTDLTTGSYCRIVKECLGSYENLKTVIQNKFFGKSDEIIYKNQRVFVKVSSNKFDEQFTNYFNDQSSNRQFVSDKLLDLSIQFGNQLKLLITILNYFFSSEQPKEIISKDLIFSGDLVNSTTKGRYEQNRIIARQSKIFEACDQQITKMSFSQIILSIIIQTFRCLLNQCRKLRLSESQYQRVEVDVLFISHVLWELAEEQDQSVITGFYYEIMSCLRQRVIGIPEPMSQEDLENSLIFLKNKINL